MTETAMGSVFRFGDWELDVAQFSLRQGGVPCRVEPKVFDVLLYLLQHAHRVVPKDELLSAVWQGDVVTAGALTQCVFQARKAIGDTGTKQRMIATVNKRGYRFIADVQVSCPGAPRQRAG